MADRGDPIQDFLAQPVWAVVGASDNPRKWGNRLFRNLLSKGYAVYPVNVRDQVIDGHRTFPSLAALPRKPDVVDTVVPPDQTDKVVAEALALGISRIWMQPGSESDAAIEAAAAAGATVVHHACAMALAMNGPARAVAK